MPGDNFHIEVRSDMREHFEEAVRIAFSNAPGAKATHYVSPIKEHGCRECVSGRKTGWRARGVSYDYPCPECLGTGVRPEREGMILLWNKDSVSGIEATLLPFPMGPDAAIAFLWHYLQTAKRSPQPDHDGDNRPGFIVTTGDFWGHVEGSHYAFLGVYPDWQMFGK